ncbi:MAG TPA: isoaspartyl peptidase/L-asparaginase [Steroidobacteraceae bacterium]|nr:isoaspartyl peptidase/L-asparaginase [Steroidobacteraceae bacterium]
MSAPAQRGSGPAWAIAIHGGAGALPGDLPLAELQQIRDALQAALVAGSSVLGCGGASLDAVQSAVRVMESSGVLNAGRGAVLNHEGLAELDAALMDGRDRRVGAVGAIRHIANPIDLARAVLDHGAHVMLVGAGAEQFARERGFALQPDGYFITARRQRELERALRAGQRVPGERAAPVSTDPQGTVGAVALDVRGDLAAATSTGGITNKHSGRIGDSPIIGAGTLAENGVCAISATGHGEWLLRLTVASDVWARVKYQGKSIDSAAREVIQALGAAGGEGGLIAIDGSGTVAMPYCSPTLIRGQASSERSPEVIVEVTARASRQSAHI